MKKMTKNKRITKNEEDEEQGDKMKTEEENAAAIEVEKVDTSIT
jgi:hypothetical protein